MKYSKSVYIIFVIQAIHLFSQTWAWRICDECVPSELLSSPAFGIDLSLDHLASAVRYHNGTVRASVKGDADVAYQALMQRFRQESKGGSLQDPFGGLQRYSEAVSGRSMFQWLFDKFDSSKTSNYPDTFEAGVILKSLNKLKEATEADIGSSMKYVGLSVPVFCTDSQAAHILRAVAKADLIVWNFGVDALAASAAQGIGLCKHYTDSSLCESEYQQLPSDDILVLDHSQSALTGALASDIGLTLRFRTTVDSYFIDHALGARHGSENGTMFWRHVTQRIAAFVRDSPRTITRVILTGSSASEPEFHGAVETAFNGLPCTIQDVLDPPLAAAVGAAELAKRAMESPGPGQGPCLEPFRCKEIRARADEGFRTEL